MTRSIISAVVISLLASLASTAQAAAPVAKHISADAKWVLHVNMEAMRGTTIGKAWHAEAAKHDRYAKMTKRMTEKLGMNPMEDLLGATVYDNKYGRHNGVALIYAAKMDHDKLTALFKEEHPDHKTAKHGDRTLYSWTEERGRHGDHSVTGCFVNDTTILLSSDAESVKTALDVIDGKKPSLAGDSDLLADMKKKTLFACRAKDVDADYKKTTRCPVLRVCSAASVVFRERKEDLAVRYDLVADDAEMAKKMSSIVDGIKAMAQLRAGGDPHAAKMIDGLKRKVKENTLTVNWSASSADIMAMMKHQRERMEKRRARHRHKDHDDHTHREGKHDSDKDHKKSDAKKDSDKGSKHKKDKKCKKGDKSKD